MGDGEDDDLVLLNHVTDLERKSRQQEPANAAAFPGARPGRPGCRGISDRVEGALHFLDEFEAKPEKLRLVPLAGQREVGSGSGVDANSNGLPAAPPVGEASTNGRPGLGGDRVGANLARPLFQFRDPRLGGVGIRAFV